MLETAMTDAGDQIAGKLNSDTPFAPQGSEEIAARLAAATEREQTSTPSVDAPAALDVSARQAMSPAVQKNALMNRLEQSFEDAAQILADDFAGPAPANGPGIPAGALDQEKEFSGRDESGTIEVTIRPPGTVTGFRIRRPWRTTVATEGFGPAVLEALSNATIATLTDWAERARLAPASEQTVIGDLPPAALQPGPNEMPGSLEELNLLLNRLDDQVEDLGRTLESPDRIAGRRVESPNRRVSVTVTGDTVTDLDIDSKWLETVTQTRLCAEFAQVLDAALGKPNRQDGIT